MTSRIGRGKKKRMKDNVKSKLIDVALAGDDLGLSYDRHGRWIIYNNSAQFDRVIFKWTGQNNRKLNMHPLPLKDALELVDTHWENRLVKSTEDVWR
jgi:NADH:ubiquinone oxidoreductase subunit